MLPPFTVHLEIFHFAKHGVENVVDLLNKYYEVIYSEPQCINITDVKIKLHVHMKRSWLVTVQ